MAEVPTVALGEGQAGDRPLHLRRPATAPIDEHHKTAMLDAGEWRATATSPIPATIGFHISALYSPVGWLSWEQIARAWEAAGQRRGDPHLPQHHARRDLGRDRRGAGLAAALRSPRGWPVGTVPEGGLFLTAGADVQKDRIEVEVWAWGRGLESWLVDHIVIDGGPEQPATWAALARCSAGLAAAAGAELRSPGSRSTPATRPRRSTPGRGGRARAGRADQGRRRLQPGEPGVGPDLRRRHGGGKRLRRGARLWTVAVSTFKAETYRFLRLERPTDEELAAGASCPGRIRASAGLGRRRVAEAVRRRAAGHGEDQARLHPARMAEAARAQRGARLPGLRPRRRLDRRPRPLDRAQAGGIWRSSWGSRRKRRHLPRCRRSPNKRRAPIHRRVSAPCGPAGWEDGRGTGCSVDNPIQRPIMTWSQAELAALRKAYASAVRCG